jgi:hypothetical protein
MAILAGSNDDLARFGHLRGDRFGPILPILMAFPTLRVAALRPILKIRG